MKNGPAWDGGSRKVINLQSWSLRKEQELGKSSVRPAIVQSASTDLPPIDLSLAPPWDSGWSDPPAVSQLMSLGLESAPVLRLEWQSSCWDRLLFMNMSELTCSWGTGLELFFSFLS